MSRKIAFGMGLIALLAVALAYPVMIALSHKTPASIPQTIPTGIWADNKISAAVELIETELGERGWASVRSGFNPQSHLTAMPAQQKGMTDVIASFCSLRAELVSRGGNADRDLSLAAALFSQADADAAEDQLLAATLALRRFDGLKARSVFEDLNSSDILTREIALFQSLLQQSSEDLNALIRSGHRTMFDQTTIRTFYQSRGRAYAIGALLRASTGMDIVRPGFGAAFANAKSSMDAIYDFAPVIVSNPPEDAFSFGGNDVVKQADLVDKAANNLALLLDILTQPSAEFELANADRS